MSRKRKRLWGKVGFGVGLGLVTAYLIDTHLTPISDSALVYAMALGILAVFVVPNWKQFFRFGPGHLYVFTVRHPKTGKAVCGYVGKTRRDPTIRYEEHLGNGRYGDPAKPWTDTITNWHVIYSSKRVSDIGLSLRERLHIKLRRPLYNYTYNLRNRRRIKSKEAKMQRTTRDRGAEWTGGRSGQVFSAR